MGSIDVRAGATPGSARRALDANDPLGPTAIVANDDKLFGMARMYSILAEQDGISVDVFRDIESAERSLDSEP